MGTVEGPFMCDRSDSARVFKLHSGEVWDLITAGHQVRGKGGRGGRAGGVLGPGKLPSTGAVLRDGV